MKVELSKIRIAHSSVSDNIYAGILDDKQPLWVEKIDVTSDFITAVLARWNGYQEIIQDSGGKKYQITVKEIK